ncbi:MAG: CocE/NonD family hydrolase [Planctomycetota bacterium]|nr:CocE/NonD family hydrolase [Planctomycetota bacterium]MDA1163867.1 CocE/NonD family hydrolase [Planctomycetota bacterium]
MSHNYVVRMQWDVKTPMRDGVDLSSDLYLPDEGGPFPCVLMRTPYSNNNEDLIRKGRRLAGQGFACVIQDVRGRWDSGGEYYPFHQEANDGFDTQEWIGRQTWSNGRIGMAGGSYLGCVQWLSAPLRNQFLTCMAPRVMCNDYFRGLFYPGGAFQLNVAMTWGMRTSAHTAQSIDFHNWTEAFHTLPVRDMIKLNGGNMPFWSDWINHPTDDEYWAGINIERRWSEITVPAFNMGGWYDLYARDSFDNFNGLRLQGGSPEARRSKLIVGPWPHWLSRCTRTGDIDFGAGSLADLETLERRWFDYWLKDDDDGFLDEPPLRLFIMGINQWRDEHEWPLARTEWQRWYLHSNGDANTLRGDGTLSPTEPDDEPADQFVYDPNFPVQTVGGNNCCSPEIVAWGPHDQRPVEMRSDVLCYTSRPFDEDTELTGPIQAVIYAATDAPDTDWTVKLVDVSPTGYAMNLCDGIIRARYRGSFSDPQLLEPGQVYEYSIDVGVTGNVFRKGHAIRIEVSSSNFPRFDRNPNTGDAFGQSIELRSASQTILHSRQYPSHVRLPVIPRQ